MAPTIQTRVHENGPTVLVKDGYQFWRDDTALRPPWRWALIAWPDDGIGIAGHGGAMTLADAMFAAGKNRALRDRVT